MNQYANQPSDLKFGMTAIDPLAVRLMASISGGKSSLINDLLNLMANYVRLPAEQIDVHQWVGPHWYVVVRDIRRLPVYEGINSPGYSRIGFTVDVSKDDIIRNANGGNCFVRDPRWLAIFKKHFIGYPIKDLHVYELHRLPKESPKCPSDCGRMRSR